MLLLAMLTACEEKTTWNLEAEQADKLVVDALITNEFKEHHVLLQKTYTALNGQPAPVSDAEIYFSWDDKTVALTETDSIAGLYLSEPFVGSINNTYNLTIVLEQDTFTSSTVMGFPITPMQPLHYTHNAENDLYFYQFTPDDIPSMEQVRYDWSAIESYCRQYGRCSAYETYYSLTTIDIIRQFAPDKEVIHFPPGTRIIRKKYSLTEEHQEFIRSVLIETDWRGGLFDVLHGNSKGNISNGALGFFAASLTLSDTTSIPVF
jgi:hypothetical protein